MSRPASPLSTVLCIAADPAGDIAAPIGAIVKDHGGVIFATGSTTTGAVFATAIAALAAARAIRRALDALGADRALQPGMALHTGPVGSSGGMYFGATVQHDLAILKATHASQIILSAAACSALNGSIPDEIELRDLGSHRLTDLLAPEYLFQVIAPDLPTTLAPLTTLDRLPNNLPLQPTPFIGRTRAITLACDSLCQAETRLLTLVAPSGTGKTRFSLELAVAMLDRFPDGVYFVALAAVNNPDVVIATIAQTLGLRETAEQTLLEQLKAYLRTREVLLILDNFEQVLAAEGAVADLLAGTERLRIVVSSHIPLRILGEHVIHLPPLDLPNPAQVSSPQALLRYDSVRLFLERVQALIPYYTCPDDQAAALAAICARLSGLPLAIELVAPYATMYDIPTLLNKVGDYALGSMTLPQVLQWTYEQFAPTTQRVFARLGVFAGGCTLEAAEMICTLASDRDIDVVNDLATLARRNLLFPEELHGGDLRYILLDCVQEFARECLVIQEEVGLIARRHGAYYLALAEEGRAALIGPQQPAWLMRLDGEQHNLRTAFHWALAHQDWETAVRLTAALGRFWHMRGAFSEGGRWLDAALPHSEQVPKLFRAQVLNVATYIYGEQGHYDRALTASEQSLALYRELGDTREMIRALSNQGALMELLGEPELAGQRYQECLALGQALGDLRTQAITLNNLGSIAMKTGDIAAAQHYIETGLELSRAAEDMVQTIEMIISLGWVLLRQNEPAQAHRTFAEGLVYCRELGGHTALALLLEGFAAGEPAPRAIRLLGAAEALREASGSPIASVDRARYDEIVAAARAQIDPVAFEIGWTEGRAMSLEQAIAYALDEMDAE